MLRSGSALHNPSNPAALDVRTREQARAIVAAAQAAVRVAQADLNKTKADAELADLDLLISLPSEHLFFVISDSPKVSTETGQAQMRGAAPTG